jgi:ATP-dependent Clp protease protease subunit
MKKGVVGFIVFLLIFATFCWAEMPEIDRDDWVSISGEIDEDKAEETITALISLDSEPGTAPIGIRVSSPGGSLMAVMAICDVIKNLQRPVVTVALGEAISGAALILSSGDQRYIGEYTMVMLHQPTIVLENWTSSFEDFRQLSGALSKIEKQMYTLLAENTRKPEHEIREMLKTELWLTAQEAIEFGLADELLSKGGLRIKKKPPPEEEKEEENSSQTRYFIPFFSGKHPS